MTWTILLLIHLAGIVAYSLLLRKQAVAGKLHPWVLATLLQTGIMTPMLIAVPFLPVDLSKFSTPTILAAAAVVALSILLLLSITKALQYLEASIYAVVYSLRIVIATALAALLLAEWPTWLQIIGGLLVLSAIILVRQKGKQRVKHTGIAWGVTATVTISVMSVLEKYLINEVGVFTAAPIITLVVGIVMWAVVLARRYPLPKKHIVTKQIGMLMVARSVAAWAYIFALAAGALVSVATFVSSLSVVVIVALGAWLLRERDYLHRKIIAALLAVIGLMAILFGGALWQQPTATTDDDRPAVVTHSTDTPSEEKPGSGYKWQGDAHDPKKITIPGIGVDAYLQNVGVDQNKEIAVPSNIHMGGWFVDSVRPGEKGLSIIDGHLNGVNEDGIFIDLEKVKQGDTFAVEFGDGSKKAFSIKAVKVIDLDQAASVLFSQDPAIASQLTLITCGGEWDKDTRLYDKRVIVISEVIS